MKKISLTISFWIFALLTLSTLFSFSISQLHEAAHKPFWLDEQFGITSTTRNHSYQNIMINGVEGQGSRSPLDYIVLKKVDEARNTKNFLNLKLKYIIVYGLILWWALWL